MVAICALQIRAASAHRRFTTPPEAPCDARKRNAFADRQTKAQNDLARLFRSAGIDAIQLRTDQPYAAELGRFFETREKRRLRG